MGTRLDLVLVPAPSEPLLEVARVLLPLSEIPSHTAPVFAHLTIAECNGVRLLAAHVAGPTHPLPLGEAVASALSLRHAPALHQWHSDSVGEAGYGVFRDGAQVEGNNTPIPDDEPLHERCQEGLRHVFPSWSHLGPEELLDTLWAPDARHEVFVLSRNGVSLPAPEPYQPQPQAAAPPSVFSREFKWGRVPRALLRGCTALYGVFLVIALLGIAAWWLFETLR